MRDDTALHIFIGPTAYDVPRDWVLGSPYTIHPPIRRGDIAKLCEDTTEIGIILIVDGVFHTFPAVGHAEIRDAIVRGWEIWGVSSMGAIRASEMISLGMFGYGQIFRQFVNDEISDDEVALLHQIDYPYAPLSEPLVHIRHFLKALKADGVISEESENTIVQALKMRWYGYRTLQVLKDLLITTCNIDMRRASHLVEKISEHKIKAIDFIEFIDFLKKKRSTHSHPVLHSSINETRP
jgi:hypothetical protein